MLAVIEAWHAAVNAGDGAAAGALCTDDVQVGGPRGTGRGRDLLVGRSSRVLRHPELSDALAALGLTPADEVTGKTRIHR